MIHIKAHLQYHLINPRQESNMIESSFSSSKTQQEFFKVLQNANQSLIAALSKCSVSDKDKKKSDLKDVVNQWKTYDKDFSVFAKIPDFILEESMESKILNMKLSTFTHKRKEDVFKKHKLQQEKRLSDKKKAAERTLLTQHCLLPQSKQTGKMQIVLRNETLGKTEKFPLNHEDLQKLKPDTDLNDTIISHYLKIFAFVFLNHDMEQSSHVYSSFFMQKLIGTYLVDDPIKGFPSVAEVNKKVRDNYSSVKRWTKSIDIFKKEVLVFPINAFSHWFCLIILKPKNLLSNGAQKAEIIYCDSMLEKRQFVVQAVRCYLQHQLEERKGVQVNLSEANLPCYQLLLPRQTNCHDCGLYMLAYIEELLSRPHELDNLMLIQNRRKLRLFPRTLTYTFRDRLRNLFNRLINANSDEEKNLILAEYKGEKESIFEAATEGEYDSINDKEFRKYEKIHGSLFQNLSESEKSYNCQVKFYVDPQINFYEKDK